MRTYQSKTLLGILMTSPCLVLCPLSKAPQRPVRCNHVKAFHISIGASFLSSHISLNRQSLPPIVLSVHSKEHSHHYFTRRPSYFDIGREISVFLLAVLRKRLFGNRLPTLRKLFMGQFFFGLS